ncbi:MAG TPA: serine--tRNA ligase [Candidatus Krumholzibacteria bacterium]|nr:serine--tRNA ligase [Candidatus Krumholzibacteria bacterium]HPD72162.1 serine--tRNA ligase [Candidatus Krumholzibacteria bacterium]HRY40906.1 serine--tRNA ligase [Candidatus Krumholzibacteria bacterium]
MLDRKFLREHRDLVAAAVAAKREAVDIGAYYEKDAERRAALQESESLQAEVNRANRAISEAKKAGLDTAAAIAGMRATGQRLKELNARAAELDAEVEALYLRIPNLPDAGVPIGGENANQVVRSWGEPRRLDHPAVPHWDLGAELGMLDVEAPARMSGSGFSLLKGDLARLERALIGWFLDTHRAAGYVEVAVPYLVSPAAMVGTGQLPKLAEDMYRCQVDDLYLIPTAEVSVTNIHRESTLAESDLPIRYCAFSPCFRREAGAAGKDTRGLLRMHQFHKVEIVHFEHPDRSREAHEELTAQAEGLLRKLELPYRVVLLATGDLSFAASRCYDLEVWSPGVGQWLEVSSCSSFTDFQARRAQIRWKGASGKGFVHTLNGSGLALPRTLVAILENYQTADGKVLVPAVLRPYLGGQDVIG